MSFYSQVSHNVHVEYQCEIEAILSQQDFTQSAHYTQDSDLGNVGRVLYIYLGDSVRHEGDMEIPRILHCAFSDFWISK